MEKDNAESSENSGHQQHSDPKQKNDTTITRHFVVSRVFPQPPQGQINEIYSRVFFEQPYSLTPDTPFEKTTSPPAQRKHQHVECNPLSPNDYNE